MKQVIRTEQAPAPFQGAPYNQAIVANGFVFVAGQLGIDPGSGQVVEGGISSQTERVFANLEAILVAAGSSLDAVVKTTVFLEELAAGAGLNVHIRVLEGKDP